MVTKLYQKKKEFISLTPQKSGKNKCQKLMTFFLLTNLILPISTAKFDNKKNFN